MNSSTSSILPQTCGQLKRVLTTEPFCPHGLFRTHTMTNVCGWILGSTSQLNRAALGAALCQDPILQEQGLAVEVTWAPVEAFPDESCTLGHQRVHAAHICCGEATRSQDCIAALFHVFDEDRPSDNYDPLYTRLFQCFINTGSYYDYLQPFGRQHHQCSALLRKVHQQQVFSLQHLLRPLSHLLAPSLRLFTLCNLQHHLHNHTAKDMTPLFLSILPSTTKGHLDLLYHCDHHSEVLQALAGGLSSQNHLCFLHQLLPTTKQPSDGTSW